MDGALNRGWKGTDACRVELEQGHGDGDPAGEIPEESPVIPGTVFQRLDPLLDLLPGWSGHA